MLRHKIRQQIELVCVLFSVRWNVEFILQSRTLSWCSQSSMNYSEKEPALQCRRQSAPPDSSSLKPGSGATEGVLDYGVLGCPGCVTWAGLMGPEDKAEDYPPCPGRTPMCVEQQAWCSGVIPPSSANQLCTTLAPPVSI